MYAGEHIFFRDGAMPDLVPGADRARFADRRTLVVGAGHSAANTLLSLAELAGEVAGYGRAPTFLLATGYEQASGCCG